MIKRIVFSFYFKKTNENNFYLFSKNYFLFYFLKLIFKKHEPNKIFKNNFLFLKT